MELRKANIETDLENLAEMNLSLIADEGHSNPMNVDQLGERMENNRTHTLRKSPVEFKG